MYILASYGQPKTRKLVQLIVSRLQLAYIYSTSLVSTPKQSRMLPASLSHHTASFTPVYSGKVTE
jgi:hypothetical protein